MEAQGSYRDRSEAGRILAQHVVEQIHDVGTMVLALPRGGVPVALEIARALDAPLDVLVVRKLGAPGQPELAFGAIAAGGVEFLNEPLIRDLGLSPPEIAVVADRETAELARRERLYRAGRAPLYVLGRTVILVDDGLATGYTMRAAIEALRHHGAGRLVIAAPVGARETCVEIAGKVDILICPFQPEPFGAVGYWYRDFSPTTDDEVREILAHRDWQAAPRPVQGQ